MKKLSKNCFQWLTKLNAKEYFIQIQASTGNTHITEKQPQRSEHFGGLNSQNYNKCHLHLIKQVGAEPSQTQVKLSYN